MTFVIERAQKGDRAAILRTMEPYNMHHVPSVEVKELDLSCFFVAKVDGQIVGAAGYEMLSPTLAKTTLLGVLPEFTGLGIGQALQLARMEAVWKEGAKKLRTNADRPDTILWYKKHYHYHPVGTLPKLMPFGLTDVDHWTTIETDLERYFSVRESSDAARQEYLAHNDPHPLSPYPPLIINVCLTGMIPTKGSNPHVPVSPDEIIEDAIRVYDAGARMLHIHARDAEGKPTPDPRLYEKIIGTIRKERPGVVCCATTSGRNWSDFESRAATLYLPEDSRPDMGSLTLGSLNFLTGPSVNSVEMVERLAMAMKEQGVKPELEVFDTGMINLAKYLERHKLVEGRKYFNLLLGNINTAPATIGNLAALAAALPANSIWAGAGLGFFQLPMNAAAIIAGGHVRVGIEDAVYYDYKKTQPASNEQLVKRVVRLAEEMQRPIASPEETRRMLGLYPRPAQALKKAA